MLLFFILPVLFKYYNYTPCVYNSDRYNIDIHISDTLVYIDTVEIFNRDYYCIRGRFSYSNDTIIVLAKRNLKCGEIELVHLKGSFERKLGFSGAFNEVWINEKKLKMNEWKVFELICK